MQWVITRLAPWAAAISPSAEIERTADLRYQGHSYELNVTEAGRPTAARAFHHEHAGIYGYATPEREIEVVTIGVRTCQRLTEPKLTREPCRKALTEIRHVWVEEA
jgi:N-methylhydantoinase A/oxoprolinase/acetone carboxylase beta subunit